MREIDRAKFLKLGLGMMLLPALPKSLTPTSPPVLPEPIAEGALPTWEPMNVYALSASTYPMVRNIEIGYETALRAFEPGRFPTLEKAVANMKPATSPKVEWPGGFNYTQIFRTGHRVSGNEYAARPTALTQRRVALLTKHMTDVENSLIWGHRSESYPGQMPLRSLGGTIDFKGKRLALRPLRDLVLRRWAEAWEDAFHEEFLGEITLQVT